MHARRARCVDIPAQGAGGRESLLQCHLYLLRARAEESDATRCAFRAAFWLSLAGATLMTAQCVIDAVIDQRQIATWAFQRIAAITAEDIGSLSAPVQQQHGLFATSQCLLQRLLQLVAEHAGIARAQL